MAQVNVIGRITADLELKTSEKSNPYVRFDIAENIGSRQALHARHRKAGANDLPPDQSGTEELLSGGHQRVMGVILMTCKKDFERYLECKGDEIDNAAYALAVALLRTHPDQTNEEILPWDMSIIAPIIESAQEELERSGKQTCRPYYEEEVSCNRTGSCKNKRCYFSEGGSDTV